MSDGAAGPTRRPRVVVGVTGATGSGVARAVLELLGAQGIERHLIVSPAGRRTAEYELSDRDAKLELHADMHYPWRDIGAPIASGSYRIDAMIVVPCSVHTLSCVAWGITDNLIARAADVTLKERRRLVLGFRETPLHAGHLRSMRAVTEAGAIVAPLAPAFYTRPQTVDELVEQLAQKLVTLAGFGSDDYARWDG